MNVSAQFVTEITRCQRQLHAFVLSMIWQPAEADDVLQETNLVLWQKAVEFDDSRPFLPWAMRFAQVQAMAHLSRRRRQEDRLIVDDALAKIMADEAAYEEPLFEARRRALADCLQKLPARHRELVSQGRKGDAASSVRHDTCSAPIGVGRPDWVRAPLPPNRACRSTAHGSPVDGLTSVRIERPRHGRLPDRTAPAWQRTHLATAEWCHSGGTICLLSLPVREPSTWERSRRTV